jgi:uncharacterized protein YjbI with pentapeptide repeats
MIETVELEEISGVNLMRDILKGRRDFSQIRLEEGFCFYRHELFEEFQEYLKKHDLKNYPLIFDGSTLRFVNLDNMYLPSVQAKGTIFACSSLRNSNLLDGDFSGADFSYAYVKNACLIRANLSNTNLWYADLASANLRDTNMQDSKLETANIRKPDLSWGRNGLE